MMPVYHQSLPYGQFSPAEAMEVSVQILKKLNWRISFISDGEIKAHTGFSWLSWNEEFTIKQEEEGLQISSKCDFPQLIDWGKNKANLRKFTDAYSAAMPTAASGETVAEGADLPEPEKPWEPDLEITKTAQIRLIDIFVFRNGYLTTPLLIFLNLFVFGFMVGSGVSWISPDPETLVHWGANFSAYTFGEWWRLITCTFLHIGVFHLVFNMYALLFIGWMLEPHIGSGRFALAYILTAVFASCISLWWHPYVVSAGASGAIFGMYGVFLALLTTNLIEKTSRRPLLISVCIFVGYNLMQGTSGMVDNAAHIGGLLSGFGIGYLYYLMLKSKSDARVVYALGGILVLSTFVFGFLFIQRSPNTLLEYDQGMEKFALHESLALEIHEMSPYTPVEILQEELRTRSLYYWKKNVRLVQQLDRLNLPPHLHRTNKALLEYCDWRIRYNMFLYRSLAIELGPPQDSMNYYLRNINQAIAKAQNIAPE